MDQDSASPITIKAVYCPGSSHQEIRRFIFPLPEPGTDCQQLFDELRRRIAAACVVTCEGLSLYYVDADQERVRFSTGEELADLLRLHRALRGPTSPGATLRILAEPAAVPAAEGDGVEHPGVRCDECRQAVRGRRFRCFLCPSYDLCQRCVLRGVHDQHSMLVLHRPGDADSLPPWFGRFGPCGGGGSGGFGRGGVGGRGGFGGWMWGSGLRHCQWQQQSPTPVPGACPKLAKKLEKARRRFEAKVAKRCDRAQRKCGRRLKQQQRLDAAASAKAEEPIRIDVDAQLHQAQHLSPEEDMLLKPLQKQRELFAKQKAKKRHHCHHIKSHCGRKRYHSGSSGSASSGSSDSSGNSSCSSDSSSDSDTETAENKAYRALLKRFSKMGFQDDETCWLWDLIREKRGNLNDILDAIRQRREAGARSQEV